MAKAVANVLFVVLVFRFRPVYEKVKVERYG